MPKNIPFNKCHIEIFICNCPLCDVTVKLANELLACNCDISVYDLRQKPDLAKALQYGVKSVPSIAVDGCLALVGKPTAEQLQALCPVIDCQRD